jgi:hypothetical protein
MGWCSRATCRAVFAEPTYLSLGVVALDDEQQRAFRIAEAAANALRVSERATAIATALAAGAKSPQAPRKDGESEADPMSEAEEAARHAAAVAAAEREAELAAARATAALVEAAASGEGSVVIYRVIGTLAYINVQRHLARLRKLSQQVSNTSALTVHALY